MENGARWCPESRWDSPVVTSVTSSAELWQPCTMVLVQWERSLLVSALNRCVSIPCLVPVRVAKDRSTPAWGEPLPGPEWTSLLRQKQIERERENHQTENHCVPLTCHLVKSSQIGDWLSVFRPKPRGSGLVLVFLVVFLPSAEPACPQD